MSVFDKKHHSKADVASEKEFQASEKESKKEAPLDEAVGILRELVRQGMGGSRGPQRNVVAEAGVFLSKFDGR